jgi:hypothetical protein
MLWRWTHYERWHVGDCLPGNTVYDPRKLESLPQRYDNFKSRNTKRVIYPIYHAHLDTVYTRGRTHLNDWADRCWGHASTTHTRDEVLCIQLISNTRFQQTSEERRPSESAYRLVLDETDYTDGVKNYLVISLILYTKDNVARKGHIVVCNRTEHFLNSGNTI